MASTKVRKHNRVINGKVVAVRGTSRVVGKPGPKIEEAKKRVRAAFDAVKVKKEKPPTLPVMPDTYARVMKLCEERGVSIDTLVSVALRSLESNKGRHFDLDTPMGFGKYAKETFGDVVKLDPNYIRWILEQQKGYTLTDQAQSLFNIWIHGG